MVMFQRVHCVPVWWLVRYYSSAIRFVGILCAKVTATLRGCRVLKIVTCAVQFFFDRY